MRLDDQNCTFPAQLQFEFPHMLAKGYSCHSFKDVAAEAMSVTCPNLQQINLVPL